MSVRGRISTTFTLWDEKTGRDIFAQMISWIQIGAIAGGLENEGEGPMRAMAGLGTLVFSGG